MYNAASSAHCNFFFFLKSSNLYFAFSSFTRLFVQASFVFVLSFTLNHECCKCILAPWLYDLTASDSQLTLQTLVVFIPNLLLPCSCFVMRQPFLAAVTLAPNEREYI